MKQTIQIIGGKYRGKKISFPNSQNLRPTPNRVRETLFNWLMYDIQGASCLDAFAGSGALGFEALSRGAKAVYLVEKQKAVYQNLCKSASMFGQDNLHILCGDANKYLQTNNTKFDIIFLDPPFNEELPNDLIYHLTHGPQLAPGGLLYIEYAKEHNLDTTYWQQLKSKISGQVHYALYQKK